MADAVTLSEQAISIGQAVFSAVVGGAFTAGLLMQRVRVVESDVRKCETAHENHTKEVRREHDLLAERVMQMERTHSEQYGSLKGDIAVLKSQVEGSKDVLEELRTLFLDFLKGQRSHN